MWGGKGIFGDFILPPNWNIVETLQKDSPWLRATKMVSLSLPPIVRLWGLVTLGAGDPLEQAEDVAGCAGTCSVGARSILPLGLSWGSLGTSGWGWWQESGVGQGPVLVAHSGLCHEKHLLPGERAWKLHSPLVASLLPGQTLVLRAPIHPCWGALGIPPSLITSVGA